MRKVTECYTAAGVPQTPDANGAFTLEDGTTYYFELAEVADRFTSLPVLQAQLEAYEP